METKDIITRLGGPNVVSRHLGITHSAVCQWSSIPINHVPHLVELSVAVGDPIAASDMRPDIPWNAVCFIPGKE